MRCISRVTMKKPKINFIVYCLIIFFSLPLMVNAFSEDFKPVMVNILIEVEKDGDEIYANKILEEIEKKVQT